MEVVTSLGNSWFYYMLSPPSIEWHVILWFIRLFFKILDVNLGMTKGCPLPPILLNTCISPFTDDWPKLSSPCKAGDVSILMPIFAEFHALEENGEQL